MSIHAVADGPSASRTAVARERRGTSRFAVVPTNRGEILRGKSRRVPAAPGRRSGDVARTPNAPPSTRLRRQKSLVGGPPAGSLLVGAGFQLDREPACLSAGSRDSSWTGWPATQAGNVGDERAWGERWTDARGRVAPRGRTSDVTRAPRRARPIFGATTTEADDVSSRVHASLDGRRGRQRQRQRLSGRALHRRRFVAAARVDRYAAQRQRRVSSRETVRQAKPQPAPCARAVRLDARRPAEGVSFHLLPIVDGALSTCACGRPPRVTRRGGGAFVARRAETAWSARRGTTRRTWRRCRDIATSTSPAHQTRRRPAPAWRRVAAAPRPRRGSIRGDGSRRRRGRDADSPWRRRGDAAAAT